ncbi:hypothetical protein GEV33_000073 [Tenebrio molitor]|uniref:Uncharacterized protein n=1 Tax=Tenebrio molitor TaxID=7067 RepID=A0A8J6HZ78_TENMO|nr:hypothetical protein GEV33_000073 [Tenebrio molitor]
MQLRRPESTQSDFQKDAKLGHEKTDQVYIKKIAGAYPVLIFTSRYCSLRQIVECRFSRPLSRGLLFSGLCRGRLDCWVADVSIAMLLSSSELAPLRVEMYKEKLKEMPLPPQPILTRWGTWLQAAMFYSEHFDSIKEMRKTSEKKNLFTYSLARDLNPEPPEFDIHAATVLGSDAGAFDAGGQSRVDKSQGLYTKYINSIGMLDSHSDTAHVQGWQFVTSLVESKATDSSSVRMVQIIHRDGNVLRLPAKNLRTEGVEAINRGNQRQNGDFSRPFAGSVGRRDDVVEFTRAVGDDSSKYHRPHRQADHGLHYGRFQTERFCGSGSHRVLSVQVVPGLTGRCRIYPPARLPSFGSVIYNVTILGAQPGFILNFVGFGRRGKTFSCDLSNFFYDSVSSGENHWNLTGLQQQPGACVWRLPLSPRGRSVIAFGVLGGEPKFVVSEEVPNWRFFRVESRSWPWLRGFAREPDLEPQSRRLYQGSSERSCRLRPPGERTSRARYQRRPNLGEDFELQWYRCSPTSADRSQGTKVVFSDVVSSRLRTRRTVAWSSAWCAGGPGRKRENRGEELGAIALRRIWNLTHGRPRVVERLVADLIPYFCTRSSRRPRDEEDLPP